MSWRLAMGARVKRGQQDGFMTFITLAATLPTSFDNNRVE